MSSASEMTSACQRPHSGLKLSFYRRHHSDMGLRQDRFVKPATRLTKLVTEMGRNPTPDQVHDLRTQTRQFETIFEVLSLNKQGARKPVLKDLIRFRKRAGKVRDMDVLMEDASMVRVEGEEECSTLLLEHLANMRRKEAKKLHSALQRMRPSARM